MRLQKCMILLPVLLALAVISGKSGAVEEMEYPVQQGDTLIGLGEQLLLDPDDWVKLQRLNRIQNPRRIPVGTIVRIPFQLLKIETLTAEITAVAGEAKINGKPAEVGMRVGAGTNMRTGESGYLALRLPDGSLMTLPARSSSHIDVLQRYPALEGQDFSLRLEEGRIESYTEPQRGPAARYRIDTPTAVIGVRGTDFRVGHDSEQGATRAETTKGAVGVGTPHKVLRAGKRREHIVEAGYGVVAHPNGQFASGALLTAPSTREIPKIFDRPLIRFILPEVAGAQAMRVQVFREDEKTVHHKKTVLFDELVRFTGMSAHEVRVPGLADGIYRLRLRAVAADGLEGHDSECVFSLEARPEPPFLTSPFSDGKVGEGPVALQWTQSSGADSYIVELADNSDFAPPMIYRNQLAADTARVDLQPGHYYWRVASMRPDGSHGPFSDTAHFETRPIPAMGEMVRADGQNMQYSWSGEEGQTFDYQFAADMNFNSVMFEGSTDTSSVMLQRPPPDTYWMRVRAIDPDGFVGPWGAPQKVVIASTFPWWVLLPLLAF